MASKTDPAASGRTFPVLPVMALGAIGAFALDAMHGNLWRSGAVDAIRKLLDEKFAYLPGSTDLIMKNFTGVGPLDHFFAGANVIFSNALDFSRPELTFVTFYFLGQLIPFLTVLMVESLRVAKGSGVLFNFLFWGMFMQLAGFGMMWPTFAIFHIIYTSKCTLPESVRQRDPIKLHTIIPTFIFGYLLLTVLLGFPFPVSEVRQRCNAIWQVFPIAVVLYQTLFTGMLKSLSLGQHVATSEVTKSRDALEYAYKFAWSIGVFTQISTYVIVCIAASFPGLFPAGVAERLTFTDAFVPSVLHGTGPMSSFASAIHNFFCYDLYCGSLAALTWAISLLAQVHPDLTSPSGIKQLARGVTISLQLAGPGGAVVALVQQRDQIVLAREAKIEKSQ